MTTLHMLAVGRIQGASEIHWALAPLEERLDAAIERTGAVVTATASFLDEIGYMHQVLDDLQAGRRQPTIRLSDADLEAMDEEAIGVGEVPPWR